MEKPEERWKSLGVAGWLVMLFATALILYVQHNEFPLEYHRDEPSKVAQIQGQFRNFLHPLLLLEAVDFSTSLFRIDMTDKQAVVETGRFISAISAALAVTILSAAAFLKRRLIASVLVGAFALLCSPIYEVAHYFKECTPHLLGHSLVIFVTFLYARKPALKWAIALGLATGIAASAKYAGVLTLFIALTILLIHHRNWRWIASSLASCFLVILFVHLPALLNAESAGNLFTGALHEEVSWMVHGHKGIGQRIPHLLVFQPLFQSISFFMCAGVIIFFIGQKWIKQPARKEDVIIISYGIAYLVLLCFMKKYSERYILPSLLILFLYGGMGLAAAYHRLLASPKRLFLAPLFGLLMIHALQKDIWKLHTYIGAFADDSRRRLADFINKTLPPDAKVAQDNMVHLEKWNQTLPVIAAEYLPMNGNMNQLRKTGVTHLAISFDSYHRFLDDTIKPDANVSSSWLAFRAFYLETKAQGELLWSSGDQNPKPLHPGIEFYKLPILTDQHSTNTTQ